MRAGLQAGSSLHYSGTVGQKVAGMTQTLPLSHPIMAPHLKSWPHCDTQCASSIANETTVLPSAATVSASRKSGFCSASGVAYNSFKVGSKLHSSDSIDCLLLAATSLLNSSASMPLSRQVLTWSLAKAMRGQTTMVKPWSSARQGSWNAKDLPPPANTLCKIESAA